VEQKDHANQGDHDEFLDQLGLEIVHRSEDQLRAVVGLDDLHPLGQADAQIVELRLHRRDRAQRILPVAHHDDPAGDLAFPVQIRDHPAHLGPDLHPRQIPQQHRGARLGDVDRDGLDVRDPGQIASGADHVLGFRALDHRPADLLVGIAHRLRHARQRDPEGPELLGIHHDLILAHHPAHGGDLGHAGHTLQLELQEPVLQTSQLGQVMPAAAIDQGIAVDPAHPGGIRSESRLRALGQGGRHLIQIFQDPRARPVDVGPVLEEDVNEAVPEEAVTAHHARAGHREHGSGDGIGDLLLDHLGRLTRERRADDHLHIREVRDGVQRGLLYGRKPPGRQQHRREQDQDTVPDRPEDDLFHPRRSRDTVPPLPVGWISEACRRCSP
jgi:hypothetical protein